MPQVMIGLSVKDHKSLSGVWHQTKHALNTQVRRRIGLRGRSSLLREFMMFGFEEASKDPEKFLRLVRDSRDPMMGKHGKSDLGAERREELVEKWTAYFPAVERKARVTRKSAP